MNGVAGEGFFGELAFRWALRIETEPGRKTSQGNCSTVRNSTSNSEAGFSVLKKLSESRVA